MPRVSPDIRKVFRAPLVLNQEYDGENFTADLSSGLADAISYGRPFISSPDLVERLRVGAPFGTSTPRDWYGPGAEGYTDFPTLAAESA